MIDVMSERVANNDGIIDDVVWIRRTYNLADAMTKSGILPQLVDMIETVKLSYEVGQSVNMTITRKDTHWNTDSKLTSSRELKRAIVSTNKYFCSRNTLLSMNKNKIYSLNKCTNYNVHKRKYYKEVIKRSYKKKL